jgi:hypothetical protein
VSRNLTPDERAARLEDARWMAETGECLDGAARRLGLTRDALERWLTVNDRTTLSALIARQPRDHNRFVANQDRRMSIGQITGQSARRQTTRHRARARARAEQEAA